VPLDLDDPRLLLREEVLEDPYPLYDLLRREAPVWQVPGQNSFLVADPALVRDVVARPEEFSSNLVSVLHRDDTGALAAFDMVPFGDPTNILATADPPSHTRHRKLLQPHLAPAALGELAPALAQIVDARLQPILDAGRGDFVKDFSDPLPALAICDVLGFPRADAPLLVEYVSGIGLLLDGVTDGDGMNEAQVAALDLLIYIQNQLDGARQRRPEDRTGLLGVLLDAIDSGFVTTDEARNLLMLLVNAGTETTSSLLATSVRTLAEGSRLQEELRAGPGRIRGAIEEILRNEGPFQFHYRWAAADTDVGGTRIPANSRVLLMWAAADRPSPGEPVDTSSEAGDRGPAPHFAFGRGMHFCIGAHLARLEATVALERLLERTSAFSLDPDRPPVRRRSISLRRHASLPIRLVARR
jgi:cytochrome P450 family 144